MTSSVNKISVHIIFGLGKSGLSCARYFDRIKQNYCIVDTRKKPPGENEISTLTHCQSSVFGDINFDLLINCEMLIVSPGISLSNVFILEAKARNIDVCGDIELFARNCKKPIVAITGSNGKSTVTDLTDKLLNASGMKSQKGGNIGLPALDFLPLQDADIYVLELSSFQLDTTRSLSTKVSVLLNISEDHMDRYDNFDCYIDSKQRIFRNADIKIFNACDQLTYPRIVNSGDYSFSKNKLSKEVIQNASYLEKTENYYNLIIAGKIISTTQTLQITGIHNWLNALTCLSILASLNISIDENILSSLNKYVGLEHRFQLVSRELGCEWINDSKATNVGATVAAIDSIDIGDSKIILIAGGDSKKSDLTPLAIPFEERISHLILLGKDAKHLAQVSNKLDIYFVKNMQEAVLKAKEFAVKGDTVLLSPACASLDMYKNFEARGEAFIEAIRMCA